MNTFVGVVKMTFNAVTYIIKNYLGVILAISAVIGLMKFPKTLDNIEAAIEEKNKTVHEWQEGATAHQEFGTAESYGIYAIAKNMLKGVLDADMLVFQFGDDADGMVGTFLEYLDDFNKWKYMLRCEDTGKKIRTIELEVGESVEVELYYDDTMLSFDNTNELEMNKMVFSSVEDTSIARIYDNSITALEKGKTILKLNHNGYLLEYPIEVK